MFSILVKRLPESLSLVGLSFRGCSFRLVEHVSSGSDEEILPNGWKRFSFLSKLTGGSSEACLFARLWDFDLRESVPGSSAESERTQKMKERAQIAKERRSSVLPTMNSGRTTNIIKIDEINSEGNLEAFVKERCHLVLQMIQSLRTKRDEGIQCAKDVSFLLKTSENQQKQIANLSQELNELQSSRRTQWTAMQGDGWSGLTLLCWLGNLASRYA